VRTMPAVPRARGRARRRILVLAPVIAAALAACGPAAGPASGSQPPAHGAPTGTVTVFAAASLTEVFTGIGHAFEAAHAGTKVEFNFGASSTLAQQISAGAPADVFAAAGPEPMRQLVDAGTVAGEPEVFARNRLVIAVPEGNPQRIGGLADLARPGLTVALCAPQVPCGAAAATALAAGGVSLEPATLEQDVKATLTKVRLGEVDAALVYRTDVAVEDSDVDAVEFPESGRAVNDYPIAALAEAPNPVGARAFVAFVRSPEARRFLVAGGFQTP